MAFLHSQSCECLKSELDLFSLPPTQTSIESGQWVHYKPISSLTNDGPIEFLVPGSGDEYIDLSHTLLYVKAKIVNEDLIKLTAEQIVAPINNWMHSLFNQLDIYLNQKLVSPPNNTYAYRSYLETLLNYGPAAKKSHLTCGLWYADTPGQMDTTNENNRGFKQRAQFVNQSSEVDMVGHLHADLFNQEKFLLNGVEMRLKLLRTRDVFNLMTNVPDVVPKVQIIDTSLLVRRTKLNPSILIAHSKALAQSNAKYPITKVEVKVLTIPSGIQGKSLDNVFIGQLPKRCIVGFVNNAAFNGNYKLNPYNFDNFKMNMFSMYIDGHQIPSKPLQLSFGALTQNVLSYQTLFSGAGIHFLNEGNDISRSDYGSGNCLFAFDLTPDLSANSSSHWNLVRHGSLRLEVRFDNALEETVNCIVYGEFDNVIEIDKDRNIYVDYSS